MWEKEGWRRRGEIRGRGEERDGLAVRRLGRFTGRIGPETRSRAVTRFKEHKASRPHEARASTLLPSY